MENVTLYFPQAPHPNFLSNSNMGLLKLDEIVVVAIHCNDSWIAKNVQEI